MAKGMLYNLTKKKWESVEKIKSDVFAQIDAVAENGVSTKTTETAKSILGGLVDEIDESNEKWLEPTHISKSVL